MTTFNNFSSIYIPDSGAGDPYPSSINVSGLNGTIENVRVTLNDVNHTYPGDVDILLVSPTGQASILMSNIGGYQTLNNVDITFDDEASASLSYDSMITSGSYQPSDYDWYYDSDFFSSPAPAGDHPADLAQFRGTDPNGEWQLFTMDDLGGFDGNIAGGWSLDFEMTAPSSVSISSPVRVIEGRDLQAQFTVSLNSPATETTSVGYRTLNGSAIRNADYVSKSGVLSFAPGEVSKTINIGIKNDDINEVDEVFTVELRNPSNGLTIESGQGVGIISDTLAAEGHTILPNRVENLTLLGSGFNGVGNSGNNIITGNNGNNNLAGAAGNDTLLGRGGADRLTGNAGNDVLVGGDGSDRFVFTSLGTFQKADFGKDVINDFALNRDKIVLSKHSFTSLQSLAGIGFSTSGEFAVVASDSEVYRNSAEIVFSSGSSTLFYNLNGSAGGLGSGGPIAELTGITNLQPNNFVLEA